MMNDTKTQYETDLNELINVIREYGLDLKLNRSEYNRTDIDMTLAMLVDQIESFRSDHKI